MTKTIQKLEMSDFIGQIETYSILKPDRFKIFLSFTIS